MPQKVQRPDGLSTVLDVTFGSVRKNQLETLLGQHPELAGLMAAGVANGSYTREMVETHLPPSFHGNGPDATVESLLRLQEFLTATTLLLHLQSLPVMGGLVQATAPVHMRNASTKTQQPAAKKRFAPKRTAAAKARPKRKQCIVAEASDGKTISAHVVEILGSKANACALVARHSGVTGLRNFLEKEGVTVKTTTLRSILNRKYGIVGAALVKLREGGVVVSTSPAPNKRSLKRTTKHTAPPTAPAKRDADHPSVTTVLLDTFGGKAKAKEILTQKLLGLGTGKALTAWIASQKVIKEAGIPITRANISSIFKRQFGRRPSEILAAEAGEE